MAIILDIIVIGGLIYCLGLLKTAALLVIIWLGWKFIQFLDL